MSFSLKKQFTGFINTPQIFAENAFFEYPLFSTEEIKEAVIASEITEPESRVLGKRMEHFFQFFITNYSSLEILAHNRQIIRGKETLGELDFLLKHPTTAEVFHVELIYKFYLYDPDSGTSEKDHLIGPNRRDSLNRKLDRLERKQFPLLYHPATQELLDSLKVDPTDVVQKMCFKAFVFLPGLQPEIEFSKINPRTLAGYWIKYRDFTPGEYDQNLFYSPRKKYWPISPQENDTWLSYREVLEQVDSFMKERLSLLIWMKTPLGAVERFFIVWW